MRNETLKYLIGKKVKKINSFLPTIIFSNGINLSIESMWRLRNSKYIIFGIVEYRNIEEQTKTLKQLAKALIGKKVKDISISSPISDLRIEFDDGLYLEIFCDSGLYESWSIMGRNINIISMPGGCSDDI